MKRLQSGRGEGGEGTTRPDQLPQICKTKRREETQNRDQGFICTRSRLVPRSWGPKKRSGRECVWVARQGRNLEGPDSFLFVSRSAAELGARKVQRGGVCGKVCVCGFVVGWLVGFSVLWAVSVCVLPQERSRDQATPPIRDPGWAHGSPAMRGLALGAAGEGTCGGAGCWPVCCGTRRCSGPSR